jgi:hypothetical protein
LQDAIERIYTDPGCASQFKQQCQQRRQRHQERPAAPNC